MLGGKLNDLRMDLKTILVVQYEEATVATELNELESARPDIYWLKQFSTAKSISIVLGSSPYNFVTRRKIL